MTSCRVPASPDLALHVAAVLKKGQVRKHAWNKTRKDMWGLTHRCHKVMQHSVDVPPQGWCRERLAGAW